MLTLPVEEEEGFDFDKLSQKDQSVHDFTDPLGRCAPIPLCSASPE